MTNIVAFLRARLDEDEQVALAANRSPWRRLNASHLDPNTVFGDGSPAGMDKLRHVCSVEMAWERDANAAHIIRNQPARVLREVAAKRAIVDECAAETGHWLDPSTVLTRRVPNDDHYSHVEMCRSTLRNLAAIWSDRPDYRDEWRAV